jgi:pilus assembly protein Flp/PilA
MDIDFFVTAGVVTQIARCIQRRVHTMRTILSSLTAHRLLQDRRGATAIEYGLIAGGIAVVLVAGIAIFGPALQTMFSDLAALL